MSVLGGGVRAERLLYFVLGDHLSCYLANLVPQFLRTQHLNVAAEAQQPPAQLMGIAYRGLDPHPAILVRRYRLVGSKRGFLEMVTGDSGKQGFQAKTSFSCWILELVIGHVSSEGKAFRFANRFIGQFYRFNPVQGQLDGVVVLPE